MFFKSMKSCIFQTRRIINCVRTQAHYNYILKRPFSSEATAGIVIIGDEILKGTADVNAPFLIKELNSINVQITKVAIVPDRIDLISAEVRELSFKCRFVLTSGGIGPTHDDVTYEAVAKAINDELELNEGLFKQYVNYFGPGSETNPGIIKYASIPKSGILHYVNIEHNNKLVKYPVVAVGNVFVFPGVPILLQKSFKQLKNVFMVSNNYSFTKNIFVNLDEFSITSVLNAAVKKFDGCVKFGSYPTFADSYYKVKLVLESSSNDNITNASKFLFEHLPENSIVNIKTDILKYVKDDVIAFSKTYSHVSSALSVMEEAIAKFSPSELCICFNGGKDCTALLHLLFACIQQFIPKEWENIKFLYVRCDEPFSEVEQFIQSTANLYKFSYVTLEGNLKDSISTYLKSHPTVKAMLMGTRRSDPGASNLNHFCHTDSDWPSVVRILPLLNWSYSDVWHFLRQLQVPYCILYDRGYTSLGDKSKTIQNPLLAVQHNHKNFQSYKPAYMLQDLEHERKSRM